MNLVLECKAMDSEITDQDLIDYIALTASQDRN